MREDAKVDNQSRTPPFPPLMGQRLAYRRVGPEPYRVSGLGWARLCPEDPLLVDAEVRERPQRMPHMQSLSPERRSPQHDRRARMLDERRSHVARAVHALRGCALWTFHRWMRSARCRTGSSVLGPTESASSAESSLPPRTRSTGHLVSP